MLKVSNKLWLISDTHFGHRGILKFGQRPENHEVQMLEHWIRLVQPDDHVLHLGDVWMANAKRWSTIISWLPGQKFLIRGNHDGSGDDLYTRAGFTLIDPFVYNGVAFTHIPVNEWTFTNRQGYVPVEILEGVEWNTNIHGHTHANPGWPDEGEMFSDKEYINVCVEKTSLGPIQLGNIRPV